MATATGSAAEADRPSVVLEAQRRIINLATAVTVAGDEVRYLVPIAMAVAAVVGARHIAGPGAWPSFALMPPALDLIAPVASDAGWIEEDGRIVSG